MSSCNGRGSCIKQCVCICYDDDDYEVLSITCTCGHRNHDYMIGGKNKEDIYCQTECIHNCQLIQCHNFTLCGKKYPQEVLDCHNGMCVDCAVMIGKVIFLNKMDDCPICMDHKEVITISCGKHNVCMECWKQMSETENRPYPLSCPLCRESIWKQK